MTRQEFDRMGRETLKEANNRVTNKVGKFD